MSCAVFVGHGFGRCGQPATDIVYESSPPETMPVCREHISWYTKYGYKVRPATPLEADLAVAEEVMES